MEVMQLHKSIEERAQAPTSLRERNKAKKHLAILNAARALLLSEGYDRTTMNLIADRAEVGVATVYKYYGTKGALVVELTRNDMEEMLVAADKVLADPPEKPVDAVIAILEAPFNLPMVKAGASLVRYFMDEMWHNQDDVGHKYMRSALAKFEKLIETLLDQFQGRGLLERNVNTKDAARIIHTLIDYNYICFARGQIGSVEAMAELTYKQVRMLFDNWSA